MSIDFTKLAEPFPAEAISWRAQTVSADGTKALALAYIDSRDVQNRLDEVCGPHGWQSEHYSCGDGRLGCKIGILTANGWVWKSDGAGATDVEAEKGAFSDALKRAAVSWGIGRYLYDLGNTWVPCESFDSGGKKRFKRFTDDCWKYVKGAAGFLPNGPQNTTPTPKVPTTPADKPVAIASPDEALSKPGGVISENTKKPGTWVIKWDGGKQYHLCTTDFKMMYETKHPNEQPK